MVGQFQAVPHSTGGSYRKDGLRQDQTETESPTAAVGHDTPAPREDGVCAKERESNPKE